MTLSVRAMTADDIPAAASILAEIVEIGGTTAIEDAPDDGTFAQWYQGDYMIACHVVVDENGLVLGFQWLGVHPKLPKTCADIATFARRNPLRPGVGRALFAATQRAATKAGYTEINATIRADNGPGLGYYSNMSFRDHSTQHGVPLKDGTPVDRISKRFQLSGGDNQ